MIKKIITYENILCEDIKKNSIKKILKKYKKISKNIFENIQKKNLTLNILSKNYKFNFRQNDLKKFREFKNLVIIGMGGSILGAEAISFFLNSKIKKRVYFFDDIDLSTIKNFKKKVKINQTLFLIISKSGNTIETLANSFLLNIIKKNCNNIIIISEKKNNILFSISKKFNIFQIEHKKHIGGRYSVLSEVGIVPAYIMGLNIKNMRNNLYKHLFDKNQSFLKNCSIKLSYLLKGGKYNNLIFLNYAPELEKFIFWCQQLIAESLGKNKKGFLPVVSNVPKDHHSLLQLYLDGPKDKIFNIFSIDFSSKERIKTKKFSDKINFMNNKSLNTIKKAQKNALISVLKRKKIPYREFIIKKIDEEVIGKLFSYFILETILIAKLSGINPFDQPAVEEVKKVTRKLLS